MDAFEWVIGIVCVVFVVFLCCWVINNQPTVDNTGITNDTPIQTPAPPGELKPGWVWECTPMNETDPSEGFTCAPAPARP
jgi:hypothetical protein